jgi:outer membrane protein assembly factor BamB
VEAQPPVSRPAQPAEPPVRSTAAAENLELASERPPQAPSASRATKKSSAVDEPRRPQATEPDRSSSGKPLPASKPAAPPESARRAPATLADAAPKPAVQRKRERPDKLVWWFPEDLLEEDRAIPLRNAPAVDASGRMFLQYQDRLVALIEEDKKPKLLWEYVIGSRAPGRVVIGPQDTLRLHCCDGLLHCLDAVTGKQVWSPANVGEPLGYAVPVVDREGNTWISLHGGGLARVDHQGRIQKPHFFRSRQKFDSPAVIADGVLYVGSELGYLFAIDICGERGVNLWNHASDHGYVGMVRSAPLVTPEKVVVAAGQNESLYGVAHSGALAWKTQMLGQILGSPVADRNGHIYVGLSQVPRGMDPQGVLVSIDGNSHKIRWEYRTAAPVESTPVIGDDDLIYFGDNGGMIHAVDFFGKLQWTADVGSPVRSAGTLLAPKRLVFGLDNESLVVLDCSAGGLAADGWPKVGRTLAQSGLA